jgi:outer membrane receptor protein involved in Fe transport
MLAALMLWGQAETGQISGTVVDASGAVVPNVTVAAKNIATGSQRATATNTAGVFVLPNLSAGDWEITLSSTGFASQKKRVTVDVGGKVAMDAKMEVGQTSTTVEVSAGAVQVNTESQTLSNTISTQQVTELPSLTRNPYDFVATVPNVTSDAQSGRGVGFAIDGMRSSSTNVMLDGVANNDEFTAMVGQQVPLDSVQEYQVVTSSFSAEYGRASGGIVNVITKSGTNDFHGSAYEFNRVSALASNSFFNDANGLPKGIYDRNNFG